MDLEEYTLDAVLKFPTPCKQRTSHLHLRWAPNYVAGPASLVPHPGRMKTAHANSPGPALHPSWTPYLLSAGGSRWLVPGSTLPTWALLPLTLLSWPWLGRPLPAPQISASASSLLKHPSSLPLVQLKRSHFYAVIHHTHPITLTSCVSVPSTPWTPLGGHCAQPPPCHMSDVMWDELFNGWPLSCLAMGSLGPRWEGHAQPWLTPSTSLNSPRSDLQVPWHDLFLTLQGSFCGQ